MFKITCAAVLAGIMFTNLSGAELKAVQNKIQYGKTAFNLQNGRISVTCPKLQLVQIAPHFTTKGKKRWYSFTNQDAAPKLVSSENNTWKFQSAIPLNAGSDVLKAAETITKVDTYHSHNTRRLDVAGMKELLKKLKLIRQDLGLGDGGC